VSLPQINPSRLQRAVAEAEFSANLDFDGLCQAVAKGAWAKDLELDAGTIAGLIHKHGTITKCEKPEVVPATSEPHTVKTYDEGGKGRKRCPSCEKYVGAVTKVCNCGHEFNGKKAEPSEDRPVEPHIVKTYDEGGKGRKRCPSCEKYVGAVTKVCNCGHEFNGKKVEPSQKSTPPSEPQHSESRPRSGYDPRLLRVSTPAGECPHKLKGFDYDTVHEWAEQVRAAGRDNGRYYTLRALVYFVRHFYDLQSEEYATVRQLLEGIYAEENDPGSLATGHQP